MFTCTPNRKSRGGDLPNIFFKGLLLFKRLLNFFKLSCQWIFMVRLIGSRGVGCVCDFIKLSQSFFTLKAKVASETLLLPWSSNFASFVP